MQKSSIFVFLTSSKINKGLLWNFFLSRIMHESNAELMIRLSIPTPCHRTWSDLTTVAGGGFCASCQKQVIDFSGLSEKEIVGHFSSPGGKVCGRFRAEQLNTPYVAKEPALIRPGLSLTKAGVIGVFLMLMGKPTMAQEKRQKQKTEVVEEKQKGFKTSPSVEDEEYWVEGSIQDKYDHSGIPGVNVLLRGTTHGTTSDVTGYFRFPVRLKKGDVLVVSFIGYMTEEYKVAAAVENTIVLKLNMDYEIMGEVAVDGLYSPKTTLWSRIKNWF